MLSDASIKFLDRQVDNIGRRVRRIQKRLHSDPAPSQEERARLDARLDVFRDELALIEAKAQHASSEERDHA